MALPGISAGSDGRVLILDSYLDAHVADGSVVIDVVTMTPREAFANTGVIGGRLFMDGVAKSGVNAHFEPRGISMDGDGDGQAIDLTADTAIVRGCLRNETREMPMSQRYACSITHANRYRFIYPMGTTARGIKIHA